jgi:hypothetical protein
MTSQTLFTIKSKKHDGIVVEVRRADMHANTTTSRPRWMFYATGKKSNRAKKWSGITSTRTNDGDHKTAIDDTFRRAVADWIESTEKREDEVIERRKQRSVARKMRRAKVEADDKLKVGDILVSTWGYEQTNVDFYQIVNRTKCYADVRPIASKPGKTESYAWAQRYVVACPDEFVGDVQRGRINIYKNREYSVNVGRNGRYSARVWDGNEISETSYH